MDGVTFDGPMGRRLKVIQEIKGYSGGLRLFRRVKVIRSENKFRMKDKWG